MEPVRKIEVVGRTLSFAEAEDEDDKFWANASVEKRIEELVNLRWMVFGDDENTTPARIAMVVTKRSLYEEDDES